MTVPAPPAPGPNGNCGQCGELVRLDAGRLVAHDRSVALPWGCEEGEYARDRRERCPGSGLTREQSMCLIQAESVVVCDRCMRDIDDGDLMDVVAEADGVAWLCLVCAIGPDVATDA